MNNEKIMVNAGDAVKNSGGTEKVTANRNYKDTVFRMIFREPGELLKLYNALNGTSYTDPDILQIVTLENAIYMNVKNDIACMLGTNLSLYEHQSTFNPNMPYRMLSYYMSKTDGLVDRRDIYNERLVKLPTPKLYVFYNGVEPQPEKKILKLSDAFEDKDDPAIEVKVTQLNINDGCNTELKKDCPMLLEYMQYVDRVRRYGKEMALTEAVDKAVSECIQEGILEDFLRKNRREVMSMSIFEYDEELHMKTLYENGQEDGFAKGLAKGREEGREEGREVGAYDTIISLVSKGRLSVKEGAEELGISEEELQAKMAKD